MNPERLAALLSRFARVRLRTDNFNPTVSNRLAWQKTVHECTLRFFGGNASLQSVIRVIRHSMLSVDRQSSRRMLVLGWVSSVRGASQTVREFGDGRRVRLRTDKLQSCCQQIVSHDKKMVHGCTLRPSLIKYCHARLNGLRPASRFDVEETGL